eukprot:gene24934-29925_t
MSCRTTHAVRTLHGPRFAQGDRCSSRLETDYESWISDRRRLHGKKFLAPFPGVAHHGIGSLKGPNHPTHAAYPFAGDPADPSAALDAIEPGQPLDPHERQAVEEDLADLAVYEALLAHRGIRGLVVCCEDCQQDHYHDWDMLRANLLQLLVDGTVRPHEPAYDPMPEAYVTWDYCRGYADASMNEAMHGDGFDS